MASILIPRKRSLVRPSSVPILNRDSPQAQGLELWLPAFAPGNARDVVGHKIAVNSGMDLAAGPLGHAWSQQSDGDELDLQGKYLVDGEFSFVWWGHPTAWNGTNPGLFRSDTGSGDTFCIFGGSTGQPFVRVGGTTLVGIDGSTAPGVSLNEDVVVAFALKSGDSAVYINGVKTHSSSTTFSAPTLGDAQIHNLGWQATPSQRISGFHYEWLFYKQRLSDDIAWRMYSPDTRWDLYWQPKIMVPVTFEAAAPAADDRATALEICYIPRS